MNQREAMYANRSRIFSKSNITTNNRAKLHQQRTQQRNLLHENRRGNINTICPTPKQPQENDKENKENHEVIEENTSVAAAASSSATDTMKTGLSKSERQQLYLKRFVEWKQQKKMIQATKQRSQPIIPELVKTPAVLKNEKKTSPITKPNHNGRRSVYELKSTSTIKPLKDTANVASKSLAAAAVVVQPKKLDFSNLAIQNKMKLQAKKETHAPVTTTVSAAAPATTSKKLVNLVNTSFDGPKKVANVVSRGAGAKARQMMERKKTTLSKSNCTAKLGTNLKAKNQQAHSMATHIKRFKKEDIEKVAENEAAYKNKTKTIKHNQNKINNNANVPKRPLPRTISNATKSISSNVAPKIKISIAPTKAVTKPTIKSLKIGSKNPALEKHKIDAKEIQTPLVVLRSSGKFDPTVTSTQERGSAHFNFESVCAATNALAHNLLNSNHKLPTTNKSTPATSKQKNQNSAQRKLLRQYAIDVEFVRNDSVYGADPGSDPDEERTKINEQSEHADVTVKPTSNNVNISCSKVSAVKERNVQAAAVGKVDKSLTTEPTTDTVDAEKQRTLEAVRFFRQQLADETLRLHQMCSDWTTYRDENLAELQKKCADDMINVTIGQTKLLTSKKFQQFNGLIDRCEAAVTGINDVINDGSEDTKPISAVDLEGFWSMVGLQVDNVEKRFADLETWKSNDWIDPEIVKPKVSKVKTELVQPKITTTKREAAVKPKSKGSSALRGLIRQKQAEMRKKIDENIENSDVLVLTPSKRHKQQQQQTNSANKSSPCRSILIKDRKQFSNSPTILLMSAKKQSNGNNGSTKSSPCRSRCKTLFGQSTPNITTNSNQMQKSNSLLRSALKGAAEQRRSLTPLGNTVPGTPLGLKSTPKRKSILKTPGTIRSAMKRQVSFNMSAMFKSINFLNESSDMEMDKDD